MFLVAFCWVLVVDGIVTSYPGYQEADNYYHWAEFLSLSDFRIRLRVSLCLVTMLVAATFEECGWFLHLKKELWTFTEQYLGPELVKKNREDVWLAVNARVQAAHVRSD